MRVFLRFAAPALAAVVVLGFANTASAKTKIRVSPSPAHSAVEADIVVVGKVTAIAARPVMALAPYCGGAKDKVAYQMATVTIESGLIGADKLKNIKIGTLLPPKPGPNAPPFVRPFPLMEGQELLLFLHKHPSEDFYMIPDGSWPIAMGGEQAKKALDSVKTVAAILADPAKALKSDKVETRAEAAAIIVLKHRQSRCISGETEQVAIPAEENKALLAALIEGDWSTLSQRSDPRPNALDAFQSLCLYEEAKWIEPVIVDIPGSPPVDHGLVQRDAFVKWLEGPGKTYHIKKIVPRTTQK